MKHLKLFEEVNQEPVIAYYDNGQKKSEYYYLNSISHRKNGPAVQGWYENGKLKLKQYCVNGKLHREHGRPQYQSWYENGNKQTEQYFINGKRHRENGPAMQFWHNNGQEIEDKHKYCLNGIAYTREEWLEQLKVIGSIHYEDEKVKYEAEKYNI